MRPAFLRANARREPLYSLQEVADRFGCPMLTLRTLLGLWPEHKPEARCSSSAAARGSCRVGMYPLSEFRRWAAHHHIDFSRYACKGKTR